MFQLRVHSCVSIESSWIVGVSSVSIESTWIVGASIVSTWIVGVLVFL